MIVIQDTRDFDCITEEIEEFHVPGILPGILDCQQYTVPICLKGESSGVPDRYGLKVGKKTEIMVIRAFCDTSR